MGSEKPGIHFSQAVKGRRLEDLSANELRAKLYNMLFPPSKIPSHCSKEELVRLVRENVNNSY